MAPANLSKLTRAASRSLRTPTTIAPHRPLLLLPNTCQNAFIARRISSRKFFTTASSQNRGIMPDTDDPTGKDVRTPAASVARTITELTDQEYHDLSEEYLDTVVSTFEEVQEQREGWDVEYAAGVLTITTPHKGIYVINKQPPNKQIWLSSPVSGPKRYDWVVLGEGQGDKEDTGAGGWIYMRDGSTLDQVFLEELDVDLSLGPSSYRG